MEVFDNADSKWCLLKKILMNQWTLWNDAISPSSEFNTVPDITVLVAGTAVQGLNIPCSRGIKVVAALTNQGSVYLGGPDVSNGSGGKRGIELSQAGMVDYPLAINNVNLLWVNADYAGDRVGIVRL